MLNLGLKRFVIRSLMITCQDSREIDCQIVNSLSPLLCISQTLICIFNLYSCIDKILIWLNYSFSSSNIFMIWCANYFRNYFRSRQRNGRNPFSSWPISGSTFCILSVHLCWYRSVFDHIFFCSKSIVWGKMLNEFTFIFTI